MSISRVVEYIFFFLILAGSGYMLWQVFSPFVSALALALIIVTICYPMYEWVERYIYHNNRSLAAAVTTLVVVILVILPLIFISAVFARELMGFYQSFSNGKEVSLSQSLSGVEDLIQVYVPEFQLNLTEQLKQSAEWVVRNIGSIFAGTVSTIFMIIISLIGSFYFFRDGKELLKIVAKISPLPDREDQIIFSRLASSIRSVATGVLLISLIQGILAAVGFSIFGIDRAVLWGAIAGLLSIIPGIGTMAIMLPAIVYLFFTGSVFNAVGLLVWGVVVVILVDNILGPNLMSRGNKMHPFLILLSVLGGISIFGPIGFIVGPVITTLFIVLLEIYDQYIIKDTRSPKK